MNNACMGGGELKHIISKSGSGFHMKLYKRGIYYDVPIGKPREYN